MGTTAQAGIRTVVISTLVVACHLGLSSMGFAGQPQGPQTIDEARLPSDFLKHVSVRPDRSNEATKTRATKNARPVTSIPGVDSLATWSEQFVADGFDSEGNPESVWPYTMVGAAPETGRTSNFNAPIIPVTVELLDSSGNVARTREGTVLRMTVTPDIVGNVLKSPIFQPFTFSDGTGQFTDQMMRAEFWNRIDHDGNGNDNKNGNGNGNDGGWHNILRPDVKQTRVMQLPLGSYFFGLNDDGSCCAVVLADFGPFVNALFPATADDTTTPIGAAEHAGDMTTRDISTLLFNNVYLFDTTIDTCCVLGFHTYDLEPGTPKNGNRERRFVLDYASWITNGLFSFGFEDVTALSHEMAELFNDPFVDDDTPWWLSIDPIFGTSLCQNNLETGDVVEVLSGNPVFAASTPRRTYHLQNEALFSWFAFESPSSARLGAYSFPDETTLTSLSPHPLLPGCKPVP
jgi:hypothetical protein